MLTKGMDGYGEISPAELGVMLSGGETPFLLDVREPAELEQAVLPGVSNVPLGDLEARVDEVPVDRLVVAICHAGHRSAAAAAFLAARGRTVVNLTGGMLAWAELGH